MVGAARSMSLSNRMHALNGLVLVLWYALNGIMLVALQNVLLQSFF